MLVYATALLSEPLTLDSLPPVETTPRGTIELRDEPGFGYPLDHDFIESVTVRTAGL